MILSFSFLYYFMYNSNYANFRTSSYYRELGIFHISVVCVGLFTIICIDIRDYVVEINKNYKRSLKRDE